MGKDRILAPNSAEWIFFQQIQERYIQEFSNNVPLGEFLINLLVATMLATMLRLFYIHFGNAISNRRRFASNFLPLALGTFLVIMIVKSSIALSLGLVGALSIVRFRAAIKDPEELVYLFMVIGIGLACGANQPLLAIIALLVILLIMWTSKQLTGESKQRAIRPLVCQYHNRYQRLGASNRCIGSSPALRGIKANGYA